MSEASFVASGQSWGQSAVSIIQENGNGESQYFRQEGSGDEG